MRKHILTQAILLALGGGLLTACGGGGSAPPAAQTPAAQPEGAYEGTTSAGMSFKALILENNELWAIYGEDIGGVLYTYGMVHGTQGNTDGSTYSANIRDYYYNGQVFTGSLTANYTARQSFNGQISTNAMSSTFTAHGIAISEYDYDAAADMNTIAGDWSGSTLGGDNGSLSISPTGLVTANFEGCLVNGQVLPRPSGKNVFNITLSFGGAPCLYPNTQATGIAVAYNLPTGGTQLIIAGTTQDQSAGTAVLAQRLAQRSR